MSSVAILTDVNATSDVTADLAGLIERAASGSREAFAELVRRYHRDVRSHLGRFIRSAADVDDLAQEVFLAAFRGLAAFDTGASFGGWLMGIARNCALHHLRGEIRRRKREASDVRAALAEHRLHVAERTDPERDGLEAAALQDCLRKLPGKSRALIDEYYFSGRTAADIARGRDVPPGAIRMSLLRIRRILADCLQERIKRLESSP